MNLKDVLSPGLTADPRVRSGEPSYRRIFTNDLYEIHAGLYPGGLLVALVHYKREGLRVMSRLGELDSAAVAMEWADIALGILRSSARGPFHLVRDAKLECRILLSLHDRAALKLAGVDVPRSAGRYKELFSE
jgi:hypothetical protein